MSRVHELAGLVKGFVRGWQSGGDREAVESARRCRRGLPDCQGCEKRHLHGYYTRFIVVGGWHCRDQGPAPSMPGVQANSGGPAVVLGPEVPVSVVSETGPHRGLPDRPGGPA